MRRRGLLVLSGAAGLVLAALFYFVALQVRGVLEFVLFIPEGEIVIFLILLGVSLLEIGVMVFALMRFAAQLPFALVCIVAAGFVAFAGVYAVGFALFARDVWGVQVLAGLAVLRWGTLWFVPVSG